MASQSVGELTSERSYQLRHRCRVKRDIPHRPRHLACNMQQAPHTRQAVPIGLANCQPVAHTALPPNHACSSACQRLPSANSRHRLPSTGLNLARDLCLAIRAGGRRAFDRACSRAEPRADGPTVTHVQLHGTGGKLHPRYPSADRLRTTHQCPVHSRLTSSRSRATYFHSTAQHRHQQHSAHNVCICRLTRVHALSAEVAYGAGWVNALCVIYNGRAASRGARCCERAAAAQVRKGPACRRAGLRRAAATGAGPLKRGGAAAKGPDRRCVSGCTELVQQGQAAAWLVQSATAPPVSSCRSTGRRAAAASDGVAGSETADLLGSATSADWIVYVDRSFCISSPSSPASP